jgi:hypothetical protein
MVKCGFWLIPIRDIGKAIVSAPKVCINLGVGIVCGAAQAVGVEVFTKNSLNDAINLQQAASACRDELPVKLTSEHDQVAGVDEKCVAIFGLVCSKAQELNALDIIKEACYNLWV